jgi:hypothetical protein
MALRDPSRWPNDSRNSMGIGLPVYLNPGLVDMKHFVLPTSSNHWNH